LLKIFLGLCHQATKIACEFHISPEDVYTYNDLEHSKLLGLMAFQTAKILLETAKILAPLASH
jgi:hypothetical protein